MDAGDLDRKLIRTGHERKLRQMAVDLALEKPEKIAVMTSLDVCQLIVDNGYMILDPGEEGFFLVRSDDMNAILRNVWRICR